ncbi:unnamed protein product [Urochloa humidicola]
MVASALKQGLIPTRYKKGFVGTVDHAGILVSRQRLLEDHLLLHQIQFTTGHNVLRISSKRWSGAEKKGL